MGKNNKRPFGGQRYMRNTQNRLQYDGPYPMQEINAAKQLFSYQFYNSGGRAMRSLKMKMQHSCNFFHEAQIETVVPSSFGAIQEEHNLHDKSNLTGNIKTMVSIDQEILIHTVDENSLKNEVSGTLSVNISDVQEPESSLIQSRRRIEQTGEPSEKRQKLSNETFTSNPVDNSGQFDTNGNIESELLDEERDDYRSNKLASISGEIKPRNINEKTVEIAISSEEEDELFEDEVKDEADVCFMCDLCLHVVRGNTKDSEDEMRRHFIQAKHNAASLVEAKIDGDKLIPRFVLEKHCLSNNSVESNILSVCPECNQIQGSIWTCAMHYQEMHNSNINNVYGLGKVVNRSIVQVSATHVCQTCHIAFPYANKLHKHWKSHKHYPFKEPLSNQIMQFICKDCGKREQSFLMQRGHILSAHSYRDNKTTNMQVLYIEKTSRLCLLPEIPKPVDKQFKEGKKLFNKAMKSTKLTRNQRKHMKKSVLPSAGVVYEYNNGATYDIDRERYERFVQNHLHYNRFHYKTHNT